MFKTPYFKLLLGLVAVVWVLHMMGLELYLYWEWWWYDILLHFLGGALMALIALWVVFFSGWIKGAPFNATSVFCIGVISAFGVGVGWEVFEYVFEVVKSDEPGYVFDTVKDLVMDTIGALFVVMIVLSRHKKQLRE